MSFSNFSTFPDEVQEWHCSCRYPPLRSWLCVSRQKNAFGKISDFKWIIFWRPFWNTEWQNPTLHRFGFPKKCGRVPFRWTCSKVDVTWPGKSKIVLLWSIFWAWGCEKKCSYMEAIMYICPRLFWLVLWIAHFPKIHGFVKLGGLVKYINN